MQYGLLLKDLCTHLCAALNLLGLWLLAIVQMLEGQIRMCSVLTCHLIVDRSVHEDFCVLPLSEPGCCGQEVKLQPWHARHRNALARVTVVCGISFTNENELYATTQLLAETSEM